MTTEYLLPGDSAVGRGEDICYKIADHDVLASTATDIEYACDPGPDAGPAARLRTTLDAAPEPVVVVVACDMPFVDASFLDWLFGKLADADGAVPYVDGVPQPTHAVFTTEPTRGTADDAVGNASGSLRDILNRLDIVEIPEPHVVEETTKRGFLDVDTSADLAALTDTDSADSKRVN